MVDKTVITEYLNNFRRYLSNYLFCVVGVQTISYPFDKGAIIVIELGMGVPTKDDSRSQSLDLKEALTRTNLFENINDVPEIPGTSILLLKNKIVYLQPIITQYFIDNKSEIWLLFLIAHSKR